MKMVTCTYCGASVDVDADPGAYDGEEPNETPGKKWRTIWCCEQCRDNPETDRWNPPKDNT